MKRIIYFIAASLVATSFVSCGGDTAETAVETCTYSYNSSNSVVEWTSFKFTERTGVKGSFNEINIHGVSEANSAQEMIESLGFDINTASVETNDPGRNEKIANFFFGTINTPVISGKVNKLMEDGKAEVEITMNDITKKVIGTYKLEDVHFSFDASINVMDWEAMSGIDALNAQCIENHTGTDGVLKLWTEVDLSFTTKLEKKCLN